MELLEFIGCGGYWIFSLISYTNGSLHGSVDAVSTALYRCVYYCPCNIKGVLHWLLSVSHYVGWIQIQKNSDGTGVRDVLVIRKRNEEEETGFIHSSVTVVTTVLLPCTSARPCLGTHKHRKTLDYINPWTGGVFLGLHDQRETWCNHQSKQIMFVIWPDGFSRRRVNYVSSSRNQNADKSLCNIKLLWKYQRTFVNREPNKEQC